MNVFQSYLVNRQTASASRHSPKTPGIYRVLSAMTLALLGTVFFSVPAQESRTGRASESSGVALARQVAADRDDTPVYGYRIVRSYPHDRNAFTQGLVFDTGFLYEGTGINGSSTLRKVELETGKILQIHHLPPKFFGEGVTLWEDKLIQLTWVSMIGFVYDKETFNLLREFNYTTEGWGITRDQTRLMMSDGSATIYFLNPDTFERIAEIEVRDKDLPITRLNELEYVKGELYANIWLTDRIARIAPETGQVVGWIDLTGLLTKEDPQQSVDVLNGIAYDADRDRLFVTGKYWPTLFEIELIPK